MGKLLGIFAHPDDESFLTAGTIAKYVKTGWTADLVYATRGEAGVRGAYVNASWEEFGGIRSRELEAAASEMGVRSVTFLDYKDGKLSHLTAGEMEDKLMAILRAERPDVVITFEPSGVNHHPDHSKVTLAATFAFQKYAEERHVEDADAIHPPKLYYAGEPESVVSYFVKKKYYPQESFGKPRRGIEDKKITTVIDIKKTSAVKSRALRAYLSKSEEIGQYLAIPNNPFLQQEYYILRYRGINESFMGKNDRVSDRL